MVRFHLILCVISCLILHQNSFAVAGTNSPDGAFVVNGVIREFGVITPEMIDQLRAELWMQVPTARQENASLLTLSPWELISARSQYPDIVTLAGVKMARIQRLTLGTAPEFVAVGRNYVMFYEGIVRGVWDMVLKRRLRLADDALKRLTKQTRARIIYLDEFEKELNKNEKHAARQSVEKGTTGLEKSRIESYLDDAEKRFDKP